MSRRIFALAGAVILCLLPIFGAARSEPPQTEPDVQLVRP